MFTVEDLKPGMLVEMKGGEYGILLPFVDGTLSICNIKDGCLQMATNIIRFYPDPGLIDSFSIIKVWDLAKNKNSNLLSPEGRKLLYNYSVKEMTIEEIEKSLGYSIKIVKNH